MAEAAQAYEYIALKRMKVQECEEDGSPKLGENGRPVMRELQPGDPIPEAGEWSNLWREVRAGRVGLAGTALAGPALADSMRRQVNRKPKGKRARRRRSLTAAEAAVASATGKEPEVGPRIQGDADSPTVGDAGSESAPQE